MTHDYGSPPIHRDEPSEPTTIAVRDVDEPFRSLLIDLGYAENELLPLVDGVITVASRVGDADRICQIAEERGYSTRRRLPEETN